MNSKVVILAMPFLLQWSCKPAADDSQGKFAPGGSAPVRPGVEVAHCGSGTPPSGPGTYWRVPLDDVWRVRVFKVEGTPAGEYAAQLTWRKAPAPQAEMPVGAPVTLARGSLTATNADLSLLSAQGEQARLAFRDLVQDTAIFRHGFPPDREGAHAVVGAFAGALEELNRVFTATWRTKLRVPTCRWISMVSSPSSSIFLLCLAAGLALGHGCSGASKSSEQRAEDPPDDAAEGDGTVVDAVPIFLTAHCSAETGPSFTKDPSLASRLTACLLKDDDGKIVDVRIIAASAVTNDTVVALDPVSKTVDSPWQVGVTRPNDPLSELRLEVEIKGERRTVKTSSFGYDWASDPLFRELIDGFVSFGDTLFPPAPLLAHESYQDVVWSPHHVAFVTDRTFAADIGIAAADAACQAAGDTLPKPKRIWRSLLGTPSEPPASRVPIVGNIYGSRGFSFGANSLEGRAWHSTLGNTETGRYVVETATPGVSPAEFNMYAWLGVTVDGADAAGASSCDGWSVSAAEKFGLALNLGLRERADVNPIEARSCAKRAHLICASLWPPSFGESANDLRTTLRQAYATAFPASKAGSADLESALLFFVIDRGGTVADVEAMYQAVASAWSDLAKKTPPAQNIEAEMITWILPDFARVLRTEPALPRADALTKALAQFRNRMLEVFPQP